MAVTPTNRPVDCYFIPRTTEAIRAGDCVFIKSFSAPSAVARVETLQADSHGNVEFQLRWYYKPEHTLGGRRSFHGAKELLLSDHHETRSASIITGKCTVYSLKEYARLKLVGPKDYYSRFGYQHVSGTVAPLLVRVFCTCELPYNPDKLMLPCSLCDDRFHPVCIGMTLEQIEQLTHYICDECSCDDSWSSSENPWGMMDVIKNDAASTELSSSAPSPSTNGLKRAPDVDFHDVNPVKRNVQKCCNEQGTLGEEEAGDQVEGMDENQV